MIRLGIDLGGTKIEGVVVEVSAGVDRPRELARARRPTDRDLGYDHVRDGVAALIREVAKQAGVDPVTTPIGVGMPGSRTRRNPDGTPSAEPLVKNANTTCLNGRPFFRDLSTTIGREVHFANDANCFALAEATWGAARGARVAFGVILGTGVGGGVVLPGADGLVAHEGLQGIAGEWGHNTLEPETGPPCYCGRRGCVESFLAGVAIEATYRERTGKALPLAEIAASADPVAKGLIAERMGLFGRAIAQIINVLDPDVVVLGGGVSKLPQLYTDGVAAAARWVFNDTLETRIVQHELGDSAGVLGAALL